MNNFQKNIFKRRTSDNIAPPITLFSASISTNLSSNTLCSQPTTINVFVQTVTDPTTLTSGDILYSDAGATSTVVGVNGEFYHLVITDVLWAGASRSYVIGISNSGSGAIGIDTICS